jgi:hypothetical protein
MLVRKFDMHSGGWRPTKKTKKSCVRGQQEQAEEMCAEQLTRMERKIDEQNSAMAAKLDALLAAVQSYRLLYW